MSLEIDLASLRTRQSAKWRVFGDDVIPAWVAEMDFALAEPIARTLHAAVDRSDTGYMQVGELPTALSEYADRTWSWTIDPELVMVVPDVLSGVAAALEAFTPPGAGIVINTPVYPPFFTTITKVTSRQAIDVPLARAESGEYRLDLDAIEAAFARPDVHALLLCSPHNPTGTVPTKDELTAIAELAITHRVMVIADEIHAPLTMPGVVHTPFLSVAPDELDAVSVFSASKAWNTAGLKCAQVVANSPRVLEQLRESTPMETIYGTGLFGVLASIAAYREGDAWLSEVRQLVAGNADLVAATIAARMPAVRFVPPEATYLAWLDMTETAISADPTAAILERGRVAVSDGATFGANGVGFIRLNLGTSRVILGDVLDRLVAVVNGS